MNKSVPHLIYGNNGVNINLLASFCREGRISTVGLCLEPKPLKHLLLDIEIRDSLIDARTIPLPDHFDKLRRLLLELRLGHELAKVDATRECLETIDIARSRRAVILLRLSTVLSSEFGTDGRKDLLDITLLDYWVHVHVIIVQDLGVL